MSWSLPPDPWTTDYPISVTNLQKIVDCLKESAAAKATAAGDIFVATALNALKRLAIGTPGQIPTVNDAGNDIAYRYQVTYVSKAFANSPYTVPEWCYHVDVDASGGAVTVNLPSAVNRAGALIEVRKTDGSANTVTVDANGAQTINGALTRVIYSQYDSYSFRSDGTNVGIV